MIKFGFPRFTWDGVFVAACILLVAAIVLGGASRQHELRLAVVELAALPLLVLGVVALVNQRIPTVSRFALLLLVAVAALPLVQLLPLPPTAWTSLPGREEMVLALNLINAPPTWSPLTLAPDKTWRSFLALIPPVAMFLGVMTLKADSRHRLVYALLAAVVVSVLLGTLQLASGGTQLYPWRTTDAGSVVGFFANRNHLATLCLMAMPFTGAIIGRALRRNAEKDRLEMWLAVALLALFVVALGVIRSRAGIVLAVPALLGSLGVTWAASGRGRPKMIMVAIAGIVALAISAVSLFALDPILSRFDTGAGSDDRFANWPIIMEAADNHLPLGSGLGSFDAVFRSVEPLERLDPTYFNQAHNDYLETWLEAGWLGAAVLVLFLIWFARRSWAAWRSSASTERDLQRAATIAISLVLMHSAADYPIRTAAIATIFALCCGLVELAGHAEQRAPSRQRTRKRPG